MSGAKTDGKAIQEAGLGGEALGELFRRIDEVEEAAREWGVQPDQVEGRFIGVMVVSMRCLGRILEEERENAARREERLRAVAEEINKRGETELEKVREMRKAIESLMEQARVAIREKDANYNKAFERQVQNIATRMIGEFEKWRVIKESAWNRKMKWKWAAAASLLTLIVAGAGYGFREWEDRGIMQAVARCRAAPDLVVPTTGEGGCFVRKLVPRDTADATKALQRAVMGLWLFGS